MSRRFDDRPQLENSLQNYGIGEGKGLIRSFVSSPMRLTGRPVALENTLESFYDAGREMKRRPPRPQRNSRSAIRSHSANDCRAIVAVDGTKIRKKIKK